MWIIVFGEDFENQDIGICDVLDRKDIEKCKYICLYYGGKNWVWRICKEILTFFGGRGGGGYKNKAR